jgi:hypothetical protein
MNANTWALARAARGPLILITLGVLFAIDQAGGLPFYRTWPILFIVFGGLKLLERVLAPEPPAQQYFPPAPPPGQGGPRP